MKRCTSERVCARGRNYLTYKYRTRICVVASVLGATPSLPRLSASMCMCWLAMCFSSVAPDHACLHEKCMFEVFERRPGVRNGRNQRSCKKAWIERTTILSFPLTQPSPFACHCTALHAFCVLSCSGGVLHLFPFSYISLVAAL